MSTIAIDPKLEAIPQPPTNLPSEDGIPLESEWHFREIMLLIELVSLHFKGREDYFAGGNMFIYFNAKQARNLDYRGPDFFFVREVPLLPQRPYWAVWEEGESIQTSLSSCPRRRLPTWIARSKRTSTRKPSTRTSTLFTIRRKANSKAVRSDNHRYREIVPDDRGWFWSEELGLWLGSWNGRFQSKDGVFLRFFDADGNLIPTAEEVADGERQRADAERRRAEAAEAELALLKDQLGKKK